MVPLPTPGIFFRGMEYMTLADRHEYRRLVDYGLFKSDASLPSYTIADFFLYVRPKEKPSQIY
jgi:hypothetical protein